jgi:hypothetical protein
VGDDDPQPGWVEARFTDAHGEAWLFFDKWPIFSIEPLSRSSEYPVEVVLPVEVIERRASEAGEVAVIRLPWGLDYDTAQDSFEVMAAHLVDD